MIIIFVFAYARIRGGKKKEENNIKDTNTPYIYSELRNF